MVRFHCVFFNDNMTLNNNSLEKNSEAWYVSSSWIISRCIWWCILPPAESQMLSLISVCSIVVLCIILISQLGLIMFIPSWFKCWFCQGQRVVWCVWLEEIILCNISLNICTLIILEIKILIFFTCLHFVNLFSTQPKRNHEQIHIG